MYIKKCLKASIYVSSSGIVSWTLRDANVEAKVVLANLESGWQLCLTYNYCFYRKPDERPWSDELLCYEFIVG